MAVLNPYQEFMAQTYLKVKGPLKNINSYTPTPEPNQPSISYVDAFIDIRESEPVKIRLPMGFDVTSLRIGEMVEWECEFKLKGSKTTITKRK